MNDMITAGLNTNQAASANNDWTAQRSYSREIYESLLERQTPDKKLVIFPITIQDKDPRGSGIGLAYKFERTGGSIGARFSRLMQSMGVIE